MYLNFSNFRGQTSAGGGGDKPWSKNGDKCRMGGIDKIFAGWGGPPSPPPQEKKPCIGERGGEARGGGEGGEEEKKKKRECVCGGASG